MIEAAIEVNPPEAAALDPRNLSHAAAFLMSLRTIRTISYQFAQYLIIFSYFSVIFSHSKGTI